MDTTDAAYLGRRERKKRETRRSIKSAALALALEHGAQHVTVEQISEAADVSPRTFFNYFSSKEEALLGESDQAVTELRELIASRPASESPLQALRAALLDSEYINAAEQRKHETIERHELMRRHPALLQLQLARYAGMENMFAEVMAHRLGLDPDSDLRPALYAAAAASVLRVATQRWTSTSDKKLRELVGEVFDLIEQGASFVAAKQDQRGLPRERAHHPDNERQEATR